MKTNNVTSKDFILWKMVISNLEKTKARKEEWQGRGGGEEVGENGLTRVVREGLIEKKVFEQRPERSEAVSHVAIWRKRFPGITKNK